MPDTTDAQRKNITVQGLSLAAPQPYEEGHALTVNEASVLNQTYLENLRNNYAGKVKKACEDNNVENAVDLHDTVKATIQTDFDTYCEAYEFGVRGGRESDPIRSQALTMATERVKAALKSKGVKLADVGVEKIRAMAETAVDTKPAFMQKAKEIVDARNAAADELAVDLDL